VIENVDDFNSRKHKRLSILLGLLGGGTAAGFVLNILHYVYKLVIKNVNDLKSLERNDGRIVIMGYIGSFRTVAYFMQIFSFEICNIKWRSRILVLIV
jgi:hypothetical protein